MAKMTPAELRQFADLQERVNDLVGDEIALYDELQRKMQGLEETAEAKEARLTTELSKIQEQLELTEDLRSLGDSLIGIDKLKLEFKEELIMIQQLENALAEKNLDRSSEEYKKLLKTIAKRRTNLGVLEASSDATKQGLKNILGYSQEFAVLGEMMLNPMEGLKGAWKELKNMNPAAWLGTLAIKSLEMSLAIDQSTVDFRKSTGASGEFDSNIRGLERNLYTAGVSAAEAGQAVQSLYLNVTGFTEMSPETQKQIGETVAMLNELGVASKTTAENIQFGTKVMGMSGEQAEELTRDLFTFAQELQVSGDQIASDFAAMGPTIAALGDQGVQAFKDLQVQAKSTGLAMDTMLKVTAQFDKFDTAAASVGKLNALLGGPYLNTLEMVTETDPSKRMDLMRDATLDAGLAFDDLSYYQKKAYTSALGLNNEMELAMFLGGNMDDIRPPEKSAAEMEELAKQTAQFNTIMEEMKQLGASLVISFGPVISVLKHIINLIQVMAPAFEALAVATMIYGVNLGFLATQAWYVSLATNTQTSAMVILTTAKGFLTGATKLLTLAWWSEAVASKFAFGWMGLIAAAFLTIAYILTTKSASPGLITILGILALSLIGLGIASSVFGWTIAGAIPWILLFAGAVLMMGVGIGMAAAGVGFMINAITSLASTEFLTGIIGVAGAIWEIVYAIDALNMMKTLAIAAVIVPLAALAPVAMVAAASAGAVSRTIEGSEPATAAGGASGPPPIINVHLKVDGTEFATAVNKVEIENYVAGKKSDMHASIVDMMKKGFLASS
tara:strand:+ start:4093 stop:6453 length:2361 start_codon:yes stop_codon:yes gene_type:complete